MTAVSAESQGIFDLFSGTVNPQPAIREQAESQLKQVMFLALLLAHI